MPEKKKSRKKHPWRACPFGKHWRSAANVDAHLRKKRRVRAHFRRGSCVTNPSGKDQIYSDEIQEITRREFVRLKGAPAPDSLGFKNGNDYDQLIRGWTDYWNSVLKPTPPLDANLVKALIASESSFNKNSETKTRDKDNRAYGLMQLLGKTFKILQNERGEIREHYINVAPLNFKDPSSNIAAGIRWLTQKYELYKKNHPRADWIDAVCKYKGYPRSHKAIKAIQKDLDRLSEIRKK